MKCLECKSRIYLNEPFYAVVYVGTHPGIPNTVLCVRCGEDETLFAKWKKILDEKWAETHA
jgi:hypothetical protein